MSGRKTTGNVKTEPVERRQSARLSDASSHVSTLKRAGSVSDKPSGSRKKTSSTGRSEKEVACQTHAHENSDSDDADLVSVMRIHSSIIKAPLPLRTHSLWTPVITGLFPANHSESVEDFRVELLASQLLDEDSKTTVLYLDMLSTVLFEVQRRVRAGLDQRRSYVDVELQFHGPVKDVEIAFYLHVRQYVGRVFTRVLANYFKIGNKPQHIWIRLALPDQETGLYQGDEGTWMEDIRLRYPDDFDAFQKFLTAYDDLTDELLPNFHLVKERNLSREYLESTKEARLAEFDRRRPQLVDKQREAAIRAEELSLEILPEPLLSF